MRSTDLNEDNYQQLINFGVIDMDYPANTEYCMTYRLEQSHRR